MSPLTCKLMARFGVIVSIDVETYVVPSHPYISPGEMMVEADASSASYFLALGALVGPLTVKRRGSGQSAGDAAFVEYLAKPVLRLSGEKTGLRQLLPSMVRSFQGIDEDFSANSGCRDDNCCYRTDVRGSDNVARYRQLAR